MRNWWWHFFLRHLLGQSWMTPQETLYAQHVHTKRLLQQTNSTPQRCITQILLHQTLFYTKLWTLHQNLSQQTTFTPQRFYTKDNTENPFTPEVLHQKPFTPSTFYTKHLWYTNPFTPKYFYTKHVFTKESLYTLNLLHQKLWHQTTLQHQQPLTPHTV